jgi:argonaute-like protein implicated in RNA metabolism and viral defense
MSKKNEELKKVGKDKELERSTAVEDALDIMHSVELNLSHLLVLFNDADLINDEANSLREITELCLAKNVKRLDKHAITLAKAYGLDIDPIETHVANTVLERDL